jgi:hypothetical membrane protein
MHFEPVNVMTTTVLASIGVAVSMMFIAVLFLEGAHRSGYDPSYHTGSELELGERGWIQRASFLLMGGGMLVLALGVYRALGSSIGAILLSIFGLGLITAGVFVPDAERGYPPGAPTVAVGKRTWRHQAHAIVGGPIAFFALFGACVTLTGPLQGIMRLYTALTAIAGVSLTVLTAVSYQRDAARTGLVQRGLIVVYWTWIVVLSVYLMMNPRP